MTYREKKFPVSDPINKKYLGKRKPLPVKGYTNQDDTAIATVNANKDLEELVLKQLDRLEKSGCDLRWLNIGRTHLQLAFMSINRSVFKPERVKP